MDKKQEFKNLVEKLIEHGESREEFDFWLKIFEELEENKQWQLIKLLENEIKELEEVKK